MMAHSQQVEHVARAFYSVDNDEQSWGQAPQELKDGFRQLARQAIAMVDLNSGCSNYPPAQTDPVKRDADSVQ
jgi:hypothetical protein